MTDDKIERIAHELEVAKSLPRVTTHWRVRAFIGQLKAIVDFMAMETEQVVNRRRIPEIVEYFKLMPEQLEAVQKLIEDFERSED